MKLLAAWILLISTPIFAEALMYPEFQPYLDIFKAELDRMAPGEMKALFEKELPNLIVDKGASEPGSDAECSYGKGEKLTVIFDSEEWPRNSNLRREAIFFHELGHCVFKYKHDNRLYGDGRPHSIMNHSSPDGDDYKAHREEYLYQFFNEAWIKREAQ